MVKLFSVDHVFQHPFERITSAFMLKYPNEHAPHVKAIDITERRLDGEGRLITNRIMSCQSALPSWLTASGLPSRCFVAEASVVDPKTKTLVVKSQNLSGASIMTVEETCTYQASSDSTPFQPTTHYRQEARITAFLPLISSKFESYSFANLQSKSAEGVAVVERLCQKIQKDGVLSLLKFDHLPSLSGSASGSRAAQ